MRQKTLDRSLPYFVGLTVDNEDGEILVLASKFVEHLSATTAARCANVRGDSNTLDAVTTIVYHAKRGGSLCTHSQAIRLILNISTCIDLYTNERQRENKSMCVHRE